MCTGPDRWRGIVSSLQGGDQGQFCRCQRPGGLPLAAAPFGPVDQFEGAGPVLHDRRAAVDPVAGIAVENAGFLGDFLIRTRPSLVAVAFDESLTTSYRNEIFPEYKANREPAPPELKRQFELCRQVTGLLGLAHFADERFEADDIIGTIGARMQARGTS